MSNEETREWVKRKRELLKTDKEKRRKTMHDPADKHKRYQRQPSAKLIQDYNNGRFTTDD